MKNISTKFINEFDQKLNTIYKDKVNLEIQLNQLDKNIVYDNNDIVIKYSNNKTLEFSNNSEVTKINLNSQLKKQLDFDKFSIIEDLISYQNWKISKIDLIQAIAQLPSNQIKYLENKVNNKKNIIKEYLKDVVWFNKKSTKKINSLVQKINDAEELIESKQKEREKLTGAKYVFEFKNSESGSEVYIHSWNAQNSVKAQTADRAKQADQADKTDQSLRSKYSEFSERSKFSDKSSESIEADYSKKSWEAENTKNADYAEKSWEASKTKTAEYAEKVDSKFIEAIVDRKLSMSDSELHSQEAFENKLKEHQDTWVQDLDILDSDNFWLDWEVNEKLTEDQKKKEAEESIIKDINQDFSEILKWSKEVLESYTNKEKQKQKKEQGGKSWKFRRIDITNTHFFWFLLLVLFSTIVGLSIAWIINIEPIVKMITSLIS